MKLGEDYFGIGFLVAANGEVLATSETYYSKSNALRGATTLSEAIKVPVEL